MALLHYTQWRPGTGTGRVATRLGMLFRGSSVGSLLPVDSDVVSK